MYIYFHSAKGKEKEKERRDERRKRSEKDDPGAHLLLAHNRREGETTSKKTRQRIGGKGLEHLLASNEAKRDGGK